MPRVSAGRPWVCPAALSPLKSLLSRSTVAGPLPELHPLRVTRLRLRCASTQAAPPSSPPLSSPLPLPQASPRPPSASPAAPMLGSAAKIPEGRSREERSAEDETAALVNRIASLSLLETSALISALKIKLNISELAPPASTTAAPAAGASGGTLEPAAETEEPPPKTEFKVMLMSFPPEAKAKVIREIKALIPGANLVEAKKFVESAPKAVRDAVSKDEAEKIKAALEAHGAVVSLD